MSTYPVRPISPLATRIFDLTSRTAAPDAGAAARTAPWTKLSRATVGWLNAVVVALKAAGARPEELYTFDRLVNAARAEGIGAPPPMSVDEKSAASTVAVMALRGVLPPSARQLFAAATTTSAAVTPRTSAQPAVTPAQSSGQPAASTPGVAEKPAVVVPATVAQPAPSATPEAVPAVEVDPLAAAIAELKGQSEATDWLNTMVSRVQLRLGRKRVNQSSENRLAAVFAGPSGVGRRFAAGVYARVLKELDALKSDEVQALDVRQILDDSDKNLLDELKKVKRGVVFLDNVNALSPQKHKDELKAIVAMAEKNEEPLVILAGPPEVRGFVTGDYRLAEPFETHVDFKPLKPEVLVEIFVQEAGRRSFEVGDEARAAAFGRLRSAGRNGAKAAMDLLKQAESNLAKRLFQPGRMTSQVYTEREMSAFTAADLQGESPFLKTGELASLSRLNENIGQAEAKAWVMSVVNTVKKNLARQAAGKVTTELNLNAILRGNPGTGKTSIVELLNDVLTELGVRNGKIVYKSASELKGDVVGAAEKAVIKAHEEAEGGILVIDEAHNLKDDPFGKKVLEAIVPLSWNKRATTSVFLLGYTEPMDEMLDVDPGLRRRFPHKPLFADFTRDELWQILEQMAKKQEYELDGTVKEVAMRALDLARAGKDFGNAGAVENMVLDAIASCAGRATEPGKEDVLIAEDFGTVPKSDDDPLERLRKFIGFDHVIEQFEKLKNALEDIKADGLVLKDNFEPYLRIEGPPGTGKSTCAEALAHIYCNLGLLSSPEVVKINAADLKADYEGQTKTTVKDIISKATGKFLLVDELSSLVRTGGPFAKEAVSALLTELENNRGRFVVGFAGYPRDVQAFLAMDEGMPRRVNTRIALRALTAQEAATLLVSSLDGKKRHLHADALEALPALMHALAAAPSWSSGGDVRTLVNKIMTEHSTIRRKPEYATWDRETVSLEAVQLAVSGMIVDKEAQAAAPEPEPERPIPLPRTQIKRQEAPPPAQQRIEVSTGPVDTAVRERVVQAAEKLLAQWGISPEDAMDALSQPGSKLAQELAEKLGMEPEEVVNELTAAASDAQVVTEEEKKTKGWKCMFCGSQNPSCPYKSLPNREEYNAIKD